MVCHQQVAQLRDALSEIRRRGAELVVVGNGTREHAAEFRERHAPDLLVLTDPARRAYRSVGLRDDLAASMRWTTIRNSARAFLEGFRQERTKGSPWQQGGVFVLGPGAQTRFAYVSQAGGDHPPVADVIAALPTV